MLNAKEFLGWQQRLRGEGLSEKRLLRALRDRRCVGDPQTFLGGASNTGQNTNRGRSPLVWDQCQWSLLDDDTNNGQRVDDDFVAFGGTVASNVGTKSSRSGSWKTYETTSASIAEVNSIPDLTNGVGGRISLLTPTGAAAVAAMELGYGNGGSFAITGNVLPKLYYETRVLLQASDHSVAGLDALFGLAEKGLAVVASSSTILTTGDAVGSKSFIGFWRVTGSTANTLNFGYRLNGQALQSNPNGAAVTITGNTWMKLGFRYDPFDRDGRYLQFFKDGKVIGWVTDCTTSVFPTGVALTPLYIVQNDSTGTLANNLDVDWLRVAQQYIAG